MVRRRRVMKATGATIIGSATLGGSASAAKGGRDEWAGVKEDPPSGNVDVRRVFYGTDDQETHPGVWIEHVFGFAFNPNSTLEEAQESFNEIEFIVELNGDDLENTKRYFDDLKLIEGERGDYYRADFLAYTPPQPPGEYTYDITAVKPDETLSVQGEYQIVPGR